MQKCPIPKKTVQRNQRRLECEKCFDLIHLRCAGVTSFNNGKAHLPGKWICCNCTLSVLPFHGQCDLDLSGSSEACDEIQTNDILETMISKSSQLKLMHLNTQSMLSTFNEFALIVNKYPLDIITLSETWLKDNKDRLEYVSFPCFSKDFRNRDNIKGGGVGAYIRDNIKYKQRKDIENTQPDMEHLWLEIQGKSKHSKLLLGNFYRSEAMHRPSVWLDKFEDLISYITTQWDGLLVRTGDMNFDLLTPQRGDTFPYLTPFMLSKSSTNLQEQHELYLITLLLMIYPR